MSADAYFIADLHLEDDRPAITLAFEQFLQQHRTAAALYILGDLFESWLGDDDDRALATRVAAALRRFTRSGPQLFIMGGNCDFLLGERFAARVGATLLSEPAVIISHHQRLLLMHGDSLCTRDIAHQEFRNLAKLPRWQDDLLARPLPDRRQLIEHLDGTREHGNEEIIDVTEREVHAVMSEHRCSTLIHGHTHRPARHETRDGQRWVLGPWDHSGWYLRLSDSGFELSEFAIEGASEGAH